MQVMLKPPSDEPLTGSASDSKAMDLSEVDIRLPMLVYVSRVGSSISHNVQWSFHTQSEL